MSIVGVILLAGAALQSNPWPYRVEWEHNGALTSNYQLCSETGDCRALDAQRIGGQTWSAPLPVLPQGFHTLVLFACNETACSAGTPTVSMNVTPGTTTNSPAPTTQPPVTTPPGGRAPPRRPPKKP